MTVRFDKFFGLKLSALVASIEISPIIFLVCTFCYKLACCLAQGCANAMQKAQCQYAYILIHKTRIITLGNSKHMTAKQGNHTFFPLLSLYMVFLSGRNIAAYRERLLCSS